MNSIKDLKQTLADEVRRLQPPPGLEARVLQQASRISHRVHQSPNGGRGAAVHLWDWKASSSPRLTALVAALIAFAIVASLVFAARELRQLKSPAPANHGPGQAVLPVDERWYWSAQDAALLVDPSAGDDFNFPTIEITHDGGRNWTSSTFQHIGIGPVLHWFDSRHLMLYSELGDAYTTTDGGDHWNLSRFGQQPGIALSYFLTVDEGWMVRYPCPTTGGCGTGNPLSAYVLYHTTDSGRHWESTGHGFPSSSVYPVEPNGLVFADDNHGYIGTYISDGFGGLVVTTDGGKTWQLVRVPSAVDGQPSNGGTTQPPTMFGNRGVLVVGTTSGDFTYTTTDNGLTWGSPQPLPGRPTQPGPCCGRNFSAGGWNDWWAVDGVGMLFRSTDQGGAWHLVQAAPGRGMAFTSVTPVGGNVLWGGATRTPSDGPRLVIRSVDGGETWSLVKLAVAGPTVYPWPSPTPEHQPCGIWTGTDRCPTARSTLE